MAKKLALYAREGVSYAWLLNPRSETLEVLVLADGQWTLLITHVGALVVRVTPFDAVELDLSLLWSRDEQ